MNKEKQKRMLLTSPDSWTSRSYDKSLSGNWLNSSSLLRAKFIFENWPTTFDHSGLFLANDSTCCHSTSRWDNFWSSLFFVLVEWMDRSIIFKLFSHETVQWKKRVAVVQKKSFFLFKTNNRTDGNSLFCALYTYICCSSLKLLIHSLNKVWFISINNFNALYINPCIVLFQCVIEFRYNDGIIIGNITCEFSCINDIMYSLFQ